MERWDKKEESFSITAKFHGLDKDKIDGYFSELDSSGFTMERYGEGRFSYMRLGGGVYRVQAEQQRNNELAEIRYTFKYFEETAWPSDWQSMGIPAPRCMAIAGAFDLESWRDRESWYGSFRANMKFIGADLGDYETVLKNNGFTEPEYKRDALNLEKRLRIGGVWYKLTISDDGGYELSEVLYVFRKDEN
jgi:hypothetical protein